MNENALVAQRFVLDPGLYAAALALFACWVSYRANPLRAVNRHFAAFLLLIALWQLTVAMARSTHNFSFWGVAATPFGGVLLFQLFMINDAVVEPRSRFIQRVRRKPLAIVGAIGYVAAVVLAWAAVRAPGFYPPVYRLVCAASLAVVFLQAGPRRAEHARINPHELLLFRISASFVAAIMVIYLLVRTSIGSWLISGVVILLLIGVIAMQLSERVLDAKGSAKIALGYLLTVAIHAVLTLIPLGIFLAAGGTLTPPVMGGFLVLGAVASYPVFAFSRRLIRPHLSPLTGQAANEARDAAVAVAGTAESDAVIVARVSDLGKSFLKGLDVTIELMSPQLPEVAAPVEGRHLLAHRARRGWLSPEGALRQFGGAELDHLLAVFRAEQIGAVIRHSGSRFTFVLYAGQRGGGTEPITGEEIEFLQELAAIASTGIERVRALEHAFRVQGMAQVGRIAAQFSHESRNQIEAILCVLEALRDGYEHRITPAHRAAVYQQAVDLATNHNLALEMVRLRPERVDLRPIDLRAAADQSATAFQNRRVRIDVSPEPAGLVEADARLLRQVLLNLFRNSVQAAAPGTVARIEVRFGRAEGFGFVDVGDNGPGVPAAIHDALFARWTTTKNDGTGLGLAFCREAMNAMRGDLHYLTPKGQRGARFRLTLPLVAEAAVVSGRERPASRA